KRTVPRPLYNTRQGDPYRILPPGCERLPEAGGPGSTTPYKGSSRPAGRRIIVAPAIKLKPGTRVRLNRNLKMFYGRVVPRGRKGEVSDYGIRKGGKRYHTMVWVWWDTERGESGAWVPIQWLTVLRSKTWMGSI